MRINSVGDNKADISLNAEELGMLANVLYFYEKYSASEKDFKKPNEVFHNLSAQIIIARDICQYGHLDSFSTSCVIKHQMGTVPDNERKRFKELLDDLMRPMQANE